ncbi:MAG: dephospho-CoA kinase [Clostridia bacterium]|nr:dephospho-CoA kinase [Clostridia bacterium]
MKIIGLTGPSGSGKSSLTPIAKELGFYVIDCDALSRRVSQLPNVLKALEKAFGGVVENGALNRKALAQKAFSSKEKTSLLNSIMLPQISLEINKEVLTAKNMGYRLVLLDAPTLFESGEDKICSDVIAVLCPKEQRAKRILERDSLTNEQLESRLNASKPDEFYKSKTGYIIYNDGNFEDYLASAKKLLSNFIK